jgi:hypothetical protein
MIVNIILIIVKDHSQDKRPLKKVINYNNNKIYNNYSNNKINNYKIPIINN